MYFDTGKIVAMTAANQDFCAVARQPDSGLSLADGSMGYDGLMACVREHAMPQETRK